MGGGNHFESNLIKIKEDREPGTILRRTDFNYLGGHGTFYRFDKNHFPNNLLDAKPKDHVSLVLHNLHTNQLDEVVFELRSQLKISDKCIRLRGHINNLVSYYDIKIEYYVNRPMESHILVYASAPPYYGCSLSP